MDPGSTVDEHSEKWTSTASARGPQKRDNTTDLAEGKMTSYSSQPIKKNNNYEMGNAHLGN